MKGLDKIPSVKHLQSAYERLYGKLPPPTEEDLALWSQWCRVDPRLAEIWIEYVRDHYGEISPLQLRELTLKHPWPAAIGVLLEHVFCFFSGPEAKIFKKWMELVLSGVEPAKDEQFFIGLRALGRKLMYEDAVFSLVPYRRWGFLGREVLFNKAQMRQRVRGWMLPKTRRLLLDRFLNEKSRITAKQYHFLLEGVISLRQAERDLRQHSQLEKFGQTKGRFYQKK
jgi:hypothetical protein